MAQDLDKLSNKELAQLAKQIKQEERAKRAAEKEAAAVKAGKPTKTANSSSGWDARLSHKILHTFVTVVITLLVVGGGAYAYYFFSQDTQSTIVNKDTGTTKTVQVAATSTKGHFDEAGFTFDLPGDWKRLQPDLSGPYKKYSYQAGLKNSENRYLYVYAGGIPLDMAVNKAVAVRSEGATLTHGQVSENCTQFTAETTPKRLKVLAKWDGVDFLCDMDAKGRNVVGTSAPGSVNKVTLTSEISFTPHDYFFVYEDNNFNPDYTIFYDMLDSFKAK